VTSLSTHAPPGSATARPTVPARLLDALPALERGVRLMVYRVLGRIAAADQVAEEVISQTFERLVKSHESYDPERPALPWLMRLATCALRDLQRIEVRRRRRAGDVPVEEIAAREQVIDPRGEDVTRAMSRLPEPQRRILELHFIEGMDGNALANALGIKPGTARVQLHRAIDMLKRQLGVDGGTHHE